MISTVDGESISSFVETWGHSSGAERANFQQFAIHLCRVIEVAEPAPSDHDATKNSYAFERSIRFKKLDGSMSPGRIDLYKKDCFVLEAKQSRWLGGKKALAKQADLFAPESVAEQKSRGGSNWEALMANAHRQAVDYVRALDDDNPPFILVCDVGYCIEVFADFTGQGKHYSRFPDPQSHRIYLDDLKKPEIRDLLRRIWNEPHTLDPEKQTAKVTRQIAKQLAEISKSIEARHRDAEDVAHFLMRCLFTMFAEDVRLLPEDCFRRWLQSARHNRVKFKNELSQLWTAMDEGGYATVAEANVRRFNGSFFKSARVLALTEDEIGTLYEAAKADWREVDPAIFGTLLEQALDPQERSRLGAHYTPRTYVQRLVHVTIMEPLRQEWALVQAAADNILGQKGRKKDALKVVRDFHHKLCTTRVLDPACGTGNFLYVALELMKELESEVVEMIIDLGGQERLAWMEKETVGPQQFLGIEKNPRAADIAELVVWLGYLKQHYRTKQAHPPEPILDDFGNIDCRDAVLTWDGAPGPKFEIMEGVQVETYPNARAAKWPDADYIVGNPPFIGGKDIRAELGDAYAETLRAVHEGINDSADFVMYWWNLAAVKLTAKKTRLERFGFVTTNSITQVFSRRTVAKHLNAKQPISLLMAIPDHPWTKATQNAAAVRIAMTVAAKGHHSGFLRKVVQEKNLDTDQPEIEFSEMSGKIHPDLTVGADATAATALRANEGLSSPGVKLHGDGFIVTRQQAELMGLGKRDGLENHILEYRNGRDLTSISRGKLVIDLWGLGAEEVRRRFPEVYQHLLETVKPDRAAQHEKSPTRDAAEYLGRWWTHGKPRQDLRSALVGLPRYIATVETAKHRVFQFLGAEILPDNMLVCIATDDSFHLGVLSSHIHVTWALNAGGTLEDRPRYSKSLCFDPFPFPECSEELKNKIRDLADGLDAHRKARLAEHPSLTLTQMYNVLAKICSGDELDDVDQRIKDQGVVVTLKTYHEDIDALVLEAYGWPATTASEQILDRLVALNLERARKEATGTISWLRPEYQIPRFGSDDDKARLKSEGLKSLSDRIRPRQGTLGLNDDLQEMMPTDGGRSKFPTGNELAETVEVTRILATASAPMTIEDVCRQFAQGRQLEKRVALTILALARLGHLTSNDGGSSFSMRTASLA